MKPSKISTILALAVAVVTAVGSSGFAAEAKFTETFDIPKKDLSPTGRNPYFILEPGYVAIYVGTEKGKHTMLTVTVTGEIKVVDGVKTRVIEERETNKGEVSEISRNFFAISRRTGDVYYFGEESHTYKNGKQSDRSGSWLAGDKGARFGLAIPGKPKVGMAYYQEQAPRKAMDRAEIVSVSETVQTPAGKFKNCVKTLETTPLGSDKEYKYYAPGIGLVKDAELSLIKSGLAAKSAR